MPLFSSHFGVTPAISSLSLSLTTGILAVAIVLTGLISEAVDRKRLMGASLAATAALGVLAALVPNWGSLLVARALLGMTLGGVPALALAYLAEETEASKLGFATGLYIGGTAIGGMSGRVIAGVAADIGGWRLALGVIGVIGVVAAVVFWRLLPPSRNFRRQRGLSLAQHFAPMKQHLQHPALPWVFASGFALMGGFVTVYNYVAYRLSEPPYDLGQGAIGAIFTVYLLGTVASTFAGRLADRHGRARVLAGGLAIMTVGLGLTLATPLVLVVVGITLITVGFFAAHAIASGWSGRLATHGKGQATGLYLLAYYLGSSIVGAGGGIFWSRGGWPGVTALVAALLVLAFVAVMRLWRWQSSDQTG